MNPPSAAGAPIDPAQTRLLADWEAPSPPLACRFDPTGRFVLASLMDFSIHRWQCDNGQHVPLLAHDSWTRALGFSPDGATFYSGGYDGRLIWWPLSADSPAPARTVDAHAGWIRALAVRPDGAWVVTAGNDAKAKIWDAAGGGLVAELPHDTQVHSVAFHPNGQSLFTGDLKGKVREWNVQPLATGGAATQTREFDAAALYLYFGGQGVDFGGVRALCISPDGKWLVAAGTTDASNPLGAIHKPLAVRFNLETGEKVHAHRSKEDINGVMWGAVFHPGTGLLIGATGGGGGGKLLFFSADAVQETVKIDLPNLARDLDLAGDGQRLVTVHHDKHVRLWTMAPKTAA